MPSRAPDLDLEVDIDLPDPYFGYAYAFAALPDDVPLLLLPVRLETRFRLDGPVRELVVRIYPDEVHADTHVPGLQPGEADAGRRFWAAIWPANTPPERRDALFARLAARLGPYRASYVLTATRPSNWSDLRTGKPAFGTAPVRDAVQPGRARLLPQRWVVVGYQGDNLLFVTPGRLVPADLAITPDFAATGRAPRHMSELMDDQGLAWLRDAGTAEALGMAIRVPLPDGWQSSLGLDLYVIGVGGPADPTVNAEALADLVAAHQWTHGVDFAWRGTPTNNSDQASSGTSVSTPDLAPLLALALAAPAVPQRSNQREAPVNPIDFKPPVFAKRTFGSATEWALGLPAGGPVSHLPGAGGAQLQLASAMNAALWPATWGYYLRSLATGAVDAGAIDWVRQRFVDHVAGGGPLPVLRLGRQPYGFLPVCVEGSEPAQTGWDRTLTDVLLDLRPEWTAAVPLVARLDPDAPDGTPPGGRLSLPEATAQLARILGATPNPSDLVARPVTDESEQFAAAWGVAVILLGAILSAAPDAAAQLGEEMAGATTLEDLIDVLGDAIHGGAPATGFLYTLAHALGVDPDVQAAALAASDFIRVVLLEGGTLPGSDGVFTPLLGNQLSRISPLLDLEPDRERVTGLLGAPPRLFGSLYAETAVRWSAPLVGDGAADWLDALVAELDDPGQPAAAPADPAPLLFQLLQHGVRVVHSEDRTALRWGLTTLAAAARDGRLADPVPELETLLGETLGACMYRIDAWLTGGVTQRLEALRTQRASGLSVGGYGWLTGLRPRTVPAPSQGHLHAPSLDHAATAAILRSGWNVLGGGLAVDLSAERVRAANWIVDALRDGQDLAELLGQSLERKLHDGHLDRHVAPLRRLVLDATGHGNRPANAIVDGLVVARAWLGADQTVTLTTDELAVRSAVRSYVDDQVGDGDRLGTVLDRHAAELDAVADTGLAQAVHALVRGNPQAASAAQEELAGGDAGPVPRSAMRTGRGGQRITHRVLLMLAPAPPTDPAAPVEALPPPDAVAEPAVEAWLAARLPLDGVVYGAWVTNAGGAESAGRCGAGARSWHGPFALSASGLSHVELLAELPEGLDLSTSRLAARLAWPLRRAAAEAGQQVEVEIDAGGVPGSGLGSERLPLRLFLPAAQRLRSVLWSARPAVPADLATRPPESSTVDSAELDARAALLFAAATSKAQRLRTAIASGSGPSSEVLDATAALASWHVTGALGPEGLSDIARAGGDPADREALLVRAAGVLAALDARLAAFGSAADAIARIRSLLPGAIALAPFAVADAATLAGSAAESARRLGGPAGALGWLHQVGRVRERIGTAATAIDLVEAATATRFEPVLLQLPDHPGEGWAATTLPNADRGPRLCLLALAWPEIGWAGDRLCGLTIDAWTEVVPDRRTTSGLAVHFDTPTAQAPQVMLLAVTPDGGTWSFDSVLDVVRQTLNRVRERAVGPEDIDGLGQFLPATYLGDDANPGVAA